LIPAPFSSSVVVDLLRRAGINMAQRARHRLGVIAANAVSILGSFTDNTCQATNFDGFAVQEEAVVFAPDGFP
jgi:hypothetical protein